MNDRNIKMKWLVGLQLLGVIVGFGIFIYDFLCDFLIFEEYICEVLFNNLNVKIKEVYEVVVEFVGIIMIYRKELR